MSIEMELPKIKWLKNNMPEGMFSQCKFYDLPDWLTKMATGKESRSLCSVVCKQGYVPPGLVPGRDDGWDADFLTKIGLSELTENNFAKLGGKNGVDGSTYLSAGQFIGYLTDEVAEEMGLTTQCCVGSAVIDAYSGWIGTVAAPTDLPIIESSGSDNNGMNIAIGRLAAVAGTSTCHISINSKEILIDGIWGPYKDILAPGFWATEGGQSMTGALLAHILSTHPAYTELGVASETSNLSKFDYLNSLLEQMAIEQNLSSVVGLAKDLFFYGDFHGNRSPIADPKMRSSIIGQSLSTNLQSLAILYLAACEFIGQQTRHIIETMEQRHAKVDTIFMSGGQCRNGLLMRLIADCTGKPVVIPRYIDASVVFGTAMLGACAYAEAAPVNINTANGAAANKIFPEEADSTAAISALTGTVPTLASSSQTLSAIKHRRISSNAHLPPSPYTIPKATSSYSNMVGMNLTALDSSKEPESYPFPDVPASNSGAVVDDDEEEEDEGISFGASKVQPPPPAVDSIRGSAADTGAKLWEIMSKLTPEGKVIYPHDKDHHDRKLLNVKFKIFKDQIDRQRLYRDMVSKV